jgi:hypothetical protein
MYIPTHLTNKNKDLQQKEIAKSKRLYKKHIFHTRKKLRSFRGKLSKHLNKVKQLYHLDPLVVNRTLSIRTGCPEAVLQKIVNKGMGAYYSSGSRPNQTPASWGIARLASAITGGPAGKIDGHLIRQCKKTGKAYKLNRRNI